MIPYTCSTKQDASIQLMQFNSFSESDEEMQKSWGRRIGNEQNEVKKDNRDVEAAEIIQLLKRASLSVVLS